MTDNQYKLELGIQLDTSDLQTQVNQAGKNIKPIDIKVDAETKELTNTIKEALKSLSAGTKNALTLDTSKLEASLNDVTSTIREIKMAMGTLDSGSNMKSLVSSINQISTALDKASDKFDGLIADLKSLSGKDFNLNFGINLGGSNPIGRNAAYGNKVRNETLPQLKHQVNEFVKFYNNAYKSSLNEFETLQKMVSGTKLGSGDFFENFLFGKDSVASRMNSGSLASQMQAYKQYIDMFKQAASLRGLDLSSVTSGFAKSADNLIQDAQDIQTGAKEMEDSFDKLKQIFSGGGVDAQGLGQVLEPIITDLSEIKVALQDLSKGVSLEGLTSSFDKLSDTIEKLVSNVALAKNALGDGFGNITGNSVNPINNIEKTSDAATDAVIQNEKKKQKAYKATADAVVYHAGIVSRLNKAETNGRFYGSNRGTGYFGTGHYFVDSATKHELDSNGHYNKLPYTSVDISKYDNLFKATTDEVADRLHTFLSNLTAFTQGSDSYDVSELFAQFKNVFGDTIMDIKEFGSRLDQLKAFMSSSSMDDRSDSVSTQFMKSLGYEGVDTRGTRFADTRYGTVIYDLKEESILQANITDELQKQGQMLEKINYEKGQVFDKSEDDRIQGIIDAQNKRREINEEFKNSFDTSGLDKAESDLSAAQNRLREIDEIIQSCQYSINNADQEARKFASDMEDIGLGYSDEEVDDYKKRLIESYNNHIDELSQEKAELQSQIPVLEEVCNRENQLANEAYERAKQTVEQRHLEAQQAQETANTVVQNEERKQQAIKQTSDVYDSVAKSKSSDIGQFDDDTEDTKELNAELKRLKDLAHQIGQLDFKIVKADYNDEINQVKEFERQLDLLKTQYNATLNSLNAKGIDINSQEITKEFADARAKIAEFEAKVRDTKAELAQNIKSNIGTTITNDINKAHTNFDKLSNKTKELHEKLKLLDSIKVDLDEAAAVNDIDRLIDANTRYQKVLKDVQTQISISQRVEKTAFDKNAFTLDKEKAMLRLKNLFGENSEAAKRFASDLDRIQKELRECGDPSGLKLINKEITNLGQRIKESGYQTQTFGQKLKKQFQQYSSYLSVASLFSYASQGLRSMFEQVKLIDSAMTELKKVTNETNEAYSNFLKNAATRSREIGTTIDGLVSSTADFARLGYDFKDAQGLAEVANIYAVVGDEIEGVEGATESLISTMAAFKDEMNGMSNTDFAMSIIDKFNEIGNNFAISSGGIGEALERSASSLMAANNTIDESIALITAANTVVQDPAQVGNAFKTISMRIRGAKTELEEAGLETDGMVESTAKLRSEILTLTGVDIMDGANQFKSTYKIMDELAAKWENLTDIQQASVTELIAGKRQGNIVSSLMTNFDTARDALETSLNSAGSAMAEHEKWQQSLEAQINKLKASWQGLSQAFLKSDFLHSAFNAVIKLVDGLTLLIDKVGVLPTLLVAFSAYKSFNGGGFFKPLIDEATGASKGITNIFSESVRKINNTFKEIGLQKDGLFKDSIEIDKKAFSEYSEMLKTTTNIDENTFNKIFENASNSAKEFAKSGRLAAEGVDAFVNSQKAAQVATLAQNKSLSNASVIIKEYYSGCKNVQMGQEDFLAAVKQTNPELANAMSNSKNAAGAMVGYTTSLVGAKVASTALKVASMALNAVLSYGIGILISYAVEGVMKLVNAKKELAEEVEELTSKFQEEHNELQKLKGDFDTSKESSMISKYEKLSKGVGNFGENISLTTDEYSEYQSIVNKIASQFPTLITGYDAQGNALLKCKDNVELLTKAYEAQIEAQNRSVFNNAGKIGEDFANKVKENESTGGGFLHSGKNLSVDVVNDMEMALNDILTGKDTDISEYFLNETTAVWNALESADLSDLGMAYTLEEVQKAFKHAAETNPEAIQDIIDNFRVGLEEDVAEMRTIAEATLSQAFDISDSKYYEMSDTMQNVARQIVNSFDYEFYKQFKDNPRGVQTHINNMLDQLKVASDTEGVAIETAFNLKTQFNNGEIPYGDYVEGLQNAGKTIDNLDLDEDIKTDIKLGLGFNEDGLVEEYQRLRRRLASDEYFNIMPSDYTSFIEDLSSEELSILWKLIPRLEETDYRETIVDVKSALEREMMLQGLTFDLNFEVESAGIEALNTALAESVTGSGLSSESIVALKGRYAELEKQGYDLSSMFEETSHGVHLNRQEFNKLEKAYASQKITEVNGQLEEMQSAYDQLGEDIRNCTDPVEKSKLFSERQLLAQRISEAGILASQYQALTSSYNDWLAAEEAGQERDMYENIIEGFENIDDEIARGWLDDGTIKMLELLTGRTDLATLSAKELKEVYTGLGKDIKHTSYSVRDFFTVDEDGNSTSQGVYNFLDAIGQLEEEAFGGKDVVKRDKNGKIIEFDFNLVGGDEAIAEALGISEELVQIMQRAADDAGFVVNMDGAYQQYADLSNEAKTATKYLNELFGEDYKFDFDTTSISSLKKDLEEAHKILDNKAFWNKDGTFNFDAKGATEAMTIVSTLQARLDSLTAEQYGIGLTVEDEEFEEPLENLQEYGRNIATLNQLKLNPKANAKEIEEINAELNETAEYFANLDKDTKVKLGFESDDGIEEVKKKIESGEVKIPTVLDIQTNMDKNLETLADLALLNSGLLSDTQEEVIRKKYKIEVEADEVDTSDVDDKVKVAFEGEKGKATVDVDGAERREHHIEIIAETFGVEDVDGLSTKLEGLDNKTIEAIAKVVGQIDVDKLKQTVATLEPRKVEAIAEAVGKGDVEGLKSAINQLSPKQVQAIAEALGYKDVNDLNTAIEGMDGNIVQAIAQALGLGDVNTLQGAVNNMHGNTVDAKVNTDGQASKVDTLQDKINSLKGKIVDVGVQIASGGKKKAAQRTGADPAGNDSEVNGTANVNGTTNRAFKQGSWGTQDSGTALVGELGREILVRNGRYYTIGDAGAEFIKYQKGDIIFNHKQTEELFTNGRVTSDGGRAKAFVTGTAFGSGSGGGIEPEVDSKSVGSDESEHKFEEVIDWIEVVLDRVERSIDKFDQQTNNIYKSWSSRNKALINEISEINNEISLQQSAYSRYIQEANKVGLSSDWALKIQSGTIDISTITDEDLANKIKSYTEWYNKALDCQDAIEELKETEASLYAQRLEHVSKEYEGILSIIEHEKNMLDEYIGQSEAQSWLVSAEYYNALIKNETETIAELENQKAAMLTEFNAAMKSGTIDENSEAWHEMIASIDEVTLAIEQSNTSLLEYQQTIQQLSWETFDVLQDKISSVIEEAEFLIELMSGDKLFDDNGKLTNKGSATMGLRGQNYNTYMYQADLVAQEAERLRKELAKDPYDTDLEERYREMISLQQEYILAAQDEKEAIKDLVSEGIELEIEALEERIDKYNEAIESQKDLYDYQKRVSEQTKNIASLQKQISSYENDNSEEARAKVQELRVSLAESEADLEEAQYDKYISDTQKMLDDLTLQYSEVINMRLDNIDALISDMIAEINADASNIGDTIREAADSVGYKLSDSMQSIWDADTKDTTNVITTYGEKFTTAQTTTNNTLQTINSNLQKMITQLNSIAKTKVKSAGTSSTAKSTQTTTSKQPTTTTPKTNSPAADGKPQVGDKVKFVSGRYYYDSQGVMPAGSKYQGQEVYITSINNKGWAKMPYHISTGKKLGSGDLGWLKLNQISGYASGKKNFLDNEIAWTQENGQEFIIRPSDGAVLTPVAKGDSILTSAASSNLWNMANSPAEFIRDNLKLDATNVPNNSNVNNSCVQNFENIVFSMPNVKNYGELLSELQKDPKFEKLIKAITLDQIVGKSSLAKNKSIR